MNEEQQNLAQIIEHAVANVYRENRFLLRFNTQELKGLEQAFAFRVGIYLYELLKTTEYRNLDLDSEYNKSIGASKMLEEFENGIRPDLILHERGTQSNNKFAIEFKGHWQKVNHKDIRKLVGLTSDAGDYNYQLGVFVQIGTDKPTFRYFINGIEHE